MDVYLGIDNGVTGTITAMNERGVILWHGPVPTKTEISFTKKKQNVTRINQPALAKLFMDHCMPVHRCLLERPFDGGPAQIKAVKSGYRAFEATLITLENLGIPYEVIDSGLWQKSLLPSGIKGRTELKKAAIDIARRLFPGTKTDDADSILIAEYARRNR